MNELEIHGFLYNILHLRKYVIVPAAQREERPGERLGRLRGSRERGVGEDDSKKGCASSNLFYLCIL